MSTSQQGPVIDLYEVGLKAIREAYVVAFGPIPEQLTSNDIDWHIVEIIKNASPKSDTIRRASIGAAALDDIISHAGNLLAAVDSRIRLAKAEDANQVRMTERLGEQHQGPTDSNESYWNHEREALTRIIHQARFARGHKTS